MNAETPSLSFREVMTGGFTLGATDPEAGLTQGKSAGVTMALHASVLIQDFERFLNDPDHLGALSGFIEFAPFGGALTGYAGVFNLFNPSGEAGLKLMVYELGFEYQSKPYYLAGQKEVRESPVMNMWHQTTTLYTRLHEGRDKTGPVVGAGVLSLGVTDLMKMVGTMQVSGAADAADKAKILGQFGGFFMGELWDSYKPHLGI